MPEDKELNTIEDQGKEVTPETITKLREQDWYRGLIEDIKSEMVEGEFNIREDLIKLRHSIGKQIANKTEDFKSGMVYGFHIAETIAEDIEKSKSTIEKSMQFYKTFPDLKAFLAKQDKTISWGKIAKQLLPSLAKAKPLLQEEKAKRKKKPKRPKVKVQFSEEAELWAVIIEDEDLKSIDVVTLKLQLESYLQNLK